MNRHISAARLANWSPVHSREYTPQELYQWNLVETRCLHNRAEKLIQSEIPKLEGDYTVEISMGTGTRNCVTSDPIGSVWLRIRHIWSSKYLLKRLIQRYFATLSFTPLDGTRAYRGN